MPRVLCIFFSSRVIEKDNRVLPPPPLLLSPSLPIFLVWDVQVIKWSHECGMQLIEMSIYLIANCLFVMRRVCRCVCKRYRSTSKTTPRSPFFRWQYFANSEISRRPQTRTTCNLRGVIKFGDFTSRTEHRKAEQNRETFGGDGMIVSATYLCERNMTIADHGLADATVFDLIFWRPSTEREIFYRNFVFVCWLWPRMLAINRPE